MAFGVVDDAGLRQGVVEGVAGHLDVLVDKGRYTSDPCDPRRAGNRGRSSFLSAVHGDSQVHGDSHRRTLSRLYCFQGRFLVATQCGSSITVALELKASESVSCNGFQGSGLVPPAHHGYHIGRSAPS